MTIRNRKNGEIILKIESERWFTFGLMEARRESGDGFLVLSIGFIRVYLPRIEFRTENDNNWFYV